MMDPKIKARWVKALRSGRYRQGKKRLQTMNGENCCLGVLIRVQHGRPDKAPEEHSEHKMPLYGPLEKFAAGLTKEQQGELSWKNDNGVTFQKLATYIEENL